MSSFIFPDNGFEWRNESLQKPPKGWYYVRESGADGILKATYQNIATVWQGDFHNAKQVLSAMKKKVRKPAAVRSDADIAALFHAHRMKQAQQSRILNMLAVEIRPGFVLDTNARPIYAPLCSTCTERRTANRFFCRSICCWGLWVCMSGIRKILL